MRIIPNDKTTFCVDVDKFVSMNSQDFTIPSISIIFVPFFSMQKRNNDNLIVNTSDLLNLTIDSWMEAFPHAKLFIVNNHNNDDIKYLNSINVPFDIFPDVETDEVGLFYVDDLFLKISDFIKTDLVLFIMQDSILPKNINNKVNFLYNYFLSTKRQFAVLGKRCDIVPPTQTDKNEKEIKNEKGIKNEKEIQNDKEIKNDSFLSFYDELKEKLINEDKLRTVNYVVNPEFSNDFILFSLKPQELNFNDIPRFLFGMYQWDTWIPGWMNEQIPVVSLGDSCGSYHLHHSKDFKYHNKMHENLEKSLVHGEKMMIASHLSLKIDNGCLLNGTKCIVRINGNF